MKWKQRDPQEITLFLQNRITKETLEASRSSYSGNDQSISFEAGRRQGFIAGMEFALKWLIAEYTRTDEDQKLDDSL